MNVHTVSYAKMLEPYTISSKQDVMNQHYNMGMENNLKAGLTRSSYITYNVPHETGNIKNGMKESQTSSLCCI